jgi:hypothetical protein
VKERAVSRPSSRLACTVAAALLATTFLNGCATYIMSGSDDLSATASSAITEITSCADDEGATLASATAKPPGERSPAEQALVTAASLKTQLAAATAQSNAAASRLDDLQAEQSNADSRIADLTAKRDALEKAMLDMAVAAKTFRDGEYKIDDIDDEDIRRTTLGSIGAVAAGALSTAASVALFPAVPIAGAVVLIANLIDSANEEDEVRIQQASLAHLMVSGAQEARSALRNAGFSEPDALRRTINASEEFISDVDRDRIAPKPQKVLRYVDELVSELLGDISSLNAQIAREQARLDGDPARGTKGIIEQTQDAFASLDEANRQLQDINDQLSEALADSGCTTTAISNPQTNDTIEATITP